MMGAFARSWKLTKLTFKVMQKDKELVLFPILAGTFSLTFIAAMVFPTIITAILKEQQISNLLFYGILFLTYLGLAIIATFFNMCVVYTAKTRFEGKNATFGDSVRFAFSRFGIILAWSLLAATVGLILRVIDNAAERMGGIGELLLKITTSLLGGTWSLVTIFVVPSMVYKNIGLVDAIKNSFATLKKTWGETLIGGVGFWLAKLALLVVDIAIFFVLLFVLPHVAGGAVIIAVFALAVIYFIGIVVFFNLANAIFSTALYQYAQTGKVPQGFDKSSMRDAFAPKK
jgi:hypothetical protein